MSHSPRRRPGRHLLLGLSLAAALPACGELDGDDAPDPRSTALEARRSGRLHIRIAGAAAGEVAAVDASTGDPIAVCTESCTLSVPVGLEVALFAFTASGFGGWAGVCAGAQPSCTFPMPARARARATFTPGPAEEWTLLLPDAVAVSADHDPDGNLIVGTTAGLRKLSAAGAPLWHQPAVAGHARVDPAGDVFAMDGQELVKVRGSDGAVLWTRDLGGSGCAFASRMGHRFETSPTGDVAIQDGGTLRVFSAAGDERWSAPVGGYCVVAVDSQGVIHVGDEDPDSIEPTILHRFTAEGVALPDTGQVAPQYQFAMAFDPSDFLLASSSGHSHVDLRRWSPQLEPVYQRRFDSGDPDSFENGVAADATGHAIWAYGLTEQFPFEGVVAHWVAPDGSLLLTLNKAPTEAFFVPLGIQVHDVSAGDGSFVLVGEYGGFGDGAGGSSGLVQSYRP